MSDTKTDSNTGAAVASDTAKVRLCRTCRHAGNAFKLGRKTHYHCLHPDSKVSGEKGTYDTLREWYQTCKSWEVNP